VGAFSKVLLLFFVLSVTDGDLISGVCDLSNVLLRFFAGWQTSGYKEEK
jgi:hypothetical protein